MITWKQIGVLVCVYAIVVLGIAGLSETTQPKKENVQSHQTGVSKSVDRAYSMPRASFVVRKNVAHIPVTIQTTLPSAYICDVPLVANFKIIPRLDIGTFLKLIRKKLSAEEYNRVFENDEVKLQFRPRLFMWKNSNHVVTIISHKRINAVLRDEKPTLVSVVMSVRCSWSGLNV